MEQILLTFSTTNNLLEIFDPVILNLMTKKSKFGLPLTPYLSILRILSTTLSSYHQNSPKINNLIIIFYYVVYNEI